MSARRLRSPSIHLVTGVERGGRAPSPPHDAPVPEPDRGVARVALVDLDLALQLACRVASSRSADRWGCTRWSSSRRSSSCSGKRTCMPRRRRSTRRSVACRARNTRGRPRGRAAVSALVVRGARHAGRALARAPAAVARPARVLEALGDAGRRAVPSAAGAVVVDEGIPRLRAEDRGPLGAAALPAREGDHHAAGVVGFDARGACVHRAVGAAARRSRAARVTPDPCHGEKRERERGRRNRGRRRSRAASRSYATHAGEDRARAPPLLLPRTDPLLRSRAAR